jgi:hypothetical protein
LSFLSFLPIVPIVIIFFVFFVLSNHSLHDLHASFKWSWISSWLRGIYNFSLFFLILFLLLLVIFVLFLKFLNIAIPHFPLSYLSSKVVGNRRTSCSSSFFNRRVNSLNLSTFVIEFISHCLLNSFNIFAWAWLFLLGLSFDLFKFGLANILDFFLNFVFIWWSMNIVSLKAEMNDQLVNWVVFLIFALEVIIHHPIGFCLWIGDN